MAKTKISEFNANPALNTDIDSINIAEGCAPSGINDAIRELMSQLKDWQSGTSNDPMVIGSTGSLTLNQGTANGVAYLNGSKVVTSGSALTYNGTGLGIGVASASNPLHIDFDGTAARIVRGSAIGFLYNTGTTSTDDFRIQSNAGGVETYAVTYAKWTLAASEQMRLTSTGLGIGTSSPTTGTKLTLQESASNPTALALLNRNSTQTWKIAVDAASVDDKILAFIDNATSTVRMALTDTGNLGIGTSSPQTKLDVASANTATDSIGNAFIKTTDTQAADVGGKLTLGGLYNASSYYAFGGIAGKKENSTSNNVAGYLQLLTTTSAGSMVERARIDSSGRFLIGTTNSGGNKLAISDGAGDTTSYGSVQVVRASSSGTSWHYSGVANGADICGFGFNSSNTAIFGQGNNPNTPNAYVAAGLIGGSNNLVFGTSGSERARIDSSGNFGIGTTSATANNSQSFAVNLGGSSATLQVNHQNGAGNAYASFNYNAGSIGSITQSGTTAVAYNTSSDYRLKENIQPMTGALAKIAQLKPCTYNWKADGSEGEGFIAHELAEVVPQCVTGEKDAVDAEGNPQYQGIDVSFLVATLTAAIQELKAEFDAYKATHP